VKTDIPVPVHSDGLVALVDDLDGDVVALVPDEMGTGGLAVDEPGLTSCAVGVVCGVSELERSEKKLDGMLEKQEYLESMLTKGSMSHRKQSSCDEERNGPELHSRVPQGKIQNVVYVQM
jgi:hypothetical protein